MQLESHATPPRESPQQRYATLHRAIERGLDSDELWKELADVALSLGHGDEAVRCMRRIRNETMRMALESRLARLGLVADAENAGGAVALERGDGHGLRDHVADAFQYLFHQHMPWLVLVTTLAFPLVVGLGGFLTAGGSPLLLAAIAALPGLCVLAIVGAMGREILRASADGNGDVPPVPGFGDLVADARNFFADAMLVLGSLLGPSLLGLWLGAPLTSTLPGLAIGAFFAPMAWALRHLDWGIDALSPVCLIRSVARAGFGYCGIAAVSTALFLPAAGVSLLTFGRPVWVQIAIIGPLCVLPLFVMSRLIGTWLDVKRQALGLRPRRRQASTPAGAPATAAAAAHAPAVTGPRQPRRPEALNQFKAPVVGRNPGKRARSAPPTARQAAAPAKAAPRAIEGRQPTPRTAEPAEPTAAPAAAPEAAVEQFHVVGARQR